jgi:FkbM family methyltransferase
MIEFNEFVKTKITDLRNTKQFLNFIQIGAYDGVSFNDMANLTLLPTDKGIFIEPNNKIFDVLKYNKIEFKDSSFLKIAIIPNSDFEHNVFYIDQQGGQSTFVKNVYNDKIHITEHVETLTVEEFYHKHINVQLDVCFLDCEGYDHDIIKTLLNYQKPKILYFESWNTITLNNQLNESKFTTRDEILDILLKNGYETKFEPIEENIIAYRND